MTTRAKVLRQLVDGELYPVDESAVAEAILLRAAVRHSVPGIGMQTSSGGESVRSFHRDARARSFRLARPRGSAAQR